MHVFPHRTGPNAEIQLTPLYIYRFFFELLKYSPTFTGLRARNKMHTPTSTHRIAMPFPHSLERSFVIQYAEAYMKKTCKTWMIGVSGHWNHFCTQVSRFEKPPSWSSSIGIPIRANPSKPNRSQRQLLSASEPQHHQCSWDASEKSLFLHKEEASLRPYIRKIRIAKMKDFTILCWDCHHIGSEIWALSMENVVSNS